jgi:ATP-binding cassette subfamily C protein LapB
LLPAVLLLQDGGAWIVTARRSVGDGDLSRYDIVIPGRVSLQASALGRRDRSRARRDPGSHWLWGTVRRFIPYYRSALLAALLSNILMLVTGLVTSVIYDKVIPHQAFVTLWALADWPAGAGAGLRPAARQLRAYLIDVAGARPTCWWARGCSARRWAAHGAPPRIGRRLQRTILGQIELVREFFASATLSAISDLPFIVIFVAMTFIVAGPLGWVLVVAIPVILLVAWLIQGSLRRATSANMQQTGRPARRAGGGGRRAGGPEGRRRAGPLPAPLRAIHRRRGRRQLRSRTSPAGP